ncbi:hypothetical protein FGG08_007275 [Glutinoglossum americanum]|uniref:Uncharacterized protein n=1 Tax=Glutinoglossum americanum TaxID=1670608 RepID=A0A9P8KU50_9PEZI|nr:hypothetical protein FGG08_007275 [Glutinoglossum americanum]
MELQPQPKRRGRPPKIPNTSAQRPKKPIVKSPAVDRRQTRHSRTTSGSASTAAKKTASTKQDSSDYQITLVDVGSSYDRETGIFTISGLRRGMMDKGPWSSVITAHAPPGKHFREEQDDEPFLARGGSKRPRIEIDLTLSDGEDAQGGDHVKIPTEPLPSLLSLKRKAEDVEDIPESAVSGKRQKPSIEPSIYIIPSKAHTTLYTREPSPPATLLIGPMRTSVTSQRVVFKEEDGIVDLTPSSPIAGQEIPPSVSQPVQAYVSGDLSQAGVNTIGAWGDGDQDLNMHMRADPDAELHMDEATTAASSPSADYTVSDQSTDDMYAALGDGDSEASDDVHALEDTASEHAGTQGQPFQRFEECQPTAGPSMPGEPTETGPKDWVVAEVRFDSDKFGDGVKTELAGPDSTVNPSKYLQEFAEPIQPPFIPTQRMVYEEEPTTKQGTSPEPQIVLEDTKIYLEQPTNPEKSPILREQRMAPELQPILGEQVAIPTKREITEEEVLPEDEAAALAERKISKRDISDEQLISEEVTATIVEQKSLVEQITSDGKAIPEEEAIVVDLNTSEDLAISEVTATIVEQKSLVEQITSDGKAIPEEEAIVVDLNTSEDLAISEVTMALGKRVIPREETDALIGRVIEAEAVTPDTRLITLTEQGTTGEWGTHDEQTVIPTIEEAFTAQDILYGKQAFLEEQEVIDSELVIPHGDARILDKQAIPDEELIVLDEQATPDKKAISEYESTELDERNIFDKRDAPNDAKMAPNNQSILDGQGVYDKEMVIVSEQATLHEPGVSGKEAVTSGEEVVLATGEDAMILYKRVHGGAVIFDERVVPNQQAIPGDERITPNERAIADEEAIVLDEQAILDQKSITTGHLTPSPQVHPDKRIVSEEQPVFDEESPRGIPSQKDVGVATNEFVDGSVDETKDLTHPHRMRRFSSGSVTSSRGGLLKPSYIVKECPVCKEKFRDMSTPDLRQHILSCLEEEWPRPPEDADDEYLGLVDRTTMFLEDLGSDNVATDDEDDEGLLIDDPPILSGPLHTIPDFRDIPMSDSERTVSEPMSDNEQLPGPYEEDISSDENESPAVDNIEAVISSKFRTITDPEKFLASLQDPEDKSTRSLYQSVQNAADTLKIWQDEWMAIEARVARLQQRKAHNPRAALDPIVFEDQKEADLYGYKWDPNPKKRGLQDPMAQRTGRMVGGRELRRRGPGLRGLAIDSDAGTQDGGRRTRSRRGDGTSDPNGSGADGGRLTGAQNGTEAPITRRSAKRAADLMDADTPEQSDAPKRRGRPRLNPLPARVQDIRNTDTFSATSTESEGTPAPVIKRRGRPPKNFKSVKPPSNQAAGTKAQNVEIGKGKQKIGSNGAPGTPIEAASSEPVKKPKSEKRSAAMQAWWDKRKSLERARIEAAAAAAAAATTSTDAGAQAAGLSSQKTSTGKPKDTNADRGDTQLLQKRRGRPPKQSTNLTVGATEVDDKAHRPKRRGRPPKSASKGLLAKPMLNIDKATSGGDVTTAPNPPLGEHTAFGQYQQLVGGSISDKPAKKRGLVGDDTSSLGKRMKISPPNFDADSEGMQSTDSSDDIDDDGDDSYYG